MSTHTTPEDLISLLRRQLRIQFPIRLDTPLLSGGLIDSFGLAGLLTEIEHEFGASIDPAAIGVDNFDTAEQMFRLIRGQ
ncbi:MAG TPA: acyl carrier protein [Pirellulales bacterium]|jgi:acyl carrier protein|nr:acyl carrier protein [Pirellulales bacterium]